VALEGERAGFDIREAVVSASLAAVLASGAFAAGQVAGVVLLITIVGLAVRDQVRRRRR
jgi:hypothetical protein